MMEYEPLEDMPFFSESRRLVNGLGYELIGLHIVRSRGSARVNAVIAGKEAGGAIGTEDCARVHRPLQERLQALTGMEDFSMEVASPGTERNIKNAAEFALFRGREARLWDAPKADWVTGVILGSTEKDLTLGIGHGNDTEGGGQTLVIPFEHIAKAKLLQP
ncbi:MAG: ribosome maturation factor [Spirochaetaceae bacterium]|jgi:ribosome maturation factor RimP|nr:ribosome maturation factor [Spirochaetaceae bacterium]